MITVYHAQHLFDGKYNPYDKESSAPIEVEKVAVVETDILEEAFLLTNNVRKSWTTNEKVRAFRAEARSTSVGDVMTAADGTVYVVDSFGFRKIKQERLVEKG